MTLITVRTFSSSSFWSCLSTSLRFCRKSSIPGGDEPIPTRERKKSQSELAFKHTHTRVNHSLSHYPELVYGLHHSYMCCPSAVHETSWLLCSWRAAPVPPPGALAIVSSEEGNSKAWKTIVVRCFFSQSPTRWHIRVCVCVPTCECNRTVIEVVM